MWRRRATYHGLLFACVSIGFAPLGCGTDESQAQNNAVNTSPAAPLDSDDDGLLDSTELAIGTDPNSPDSPCVTEVYTAGLQSRPIDIIFVIDNSGSMREEIEAIEANINANFAAIMDAAQIDYRVIMVTQHGEGNAFDAAVCISAPLSGTSCAPIPDSPVESNRFFHFDTKISSDDSFSKILSTYSGWSSWLRDDAFKVFIGFSDDNSAMNPERFEASLLALEPPQFGVPGGRNYVWHSVVGLWPREPSDSAYGPNEALQNFVCQTAENSGDAYQKLSIVTGGLRYPVCNTDTYDAIFRAAAVEIIDDATISCSLRRLSAPDGFGVDDSRTALELTAGGTTRTITRVNAMGDCVSNGFYITDYSLELCPTLCAQVEGLDSGTLRAVASCSVQTCDSPQPEICDDGIDNDCNGFTDRRDLNCFL
jgi:hypothetical protein